MNSVNPGALVRPIRLLGTVVGQYDDQDRLNRYCPELPGGGPHVVAGLPCFDYVYDASGNLTAKTNLADSTTTTFEFDEMGSLLNVTHGTDTIDYEVDAQGRRVGKWKNGSKEWGMLYGDALRPIARLNASGAIDSIYVYGSRSNVPDYIATQDNVYRILADQLGSVRFVVDALSHPLVLSTHSHPSKHRISPRNWC